MYREKRTVVKRIHSILLGFAILLILSCFVVNADTPKIETSDVEYHYSGAGFHEELYDRFFPDPPPEGFDYHTRMIATANIDDTIEKEKIVLTLVDTKPRAPFGNGHQAFLLITDTKSYWDPQKKALFKLFDSRTHQLDVSAKAIELHDPPFISKQPTDTAFRLIDLTGDGTLDVWVESAYGVALISFEDGAFKEVFNNYPVTKQKLTETPDVAYFYYRDAPLEPEGRKYHRFLQFPAPKDAPYGTRMKAIANIDNTPEKETIVLMVAEGGGDEWGQWCQAFLLIAETETEADKLPKKKELFKLFDAGVYNFDVPGKNIAIRNPPFVFKTLWGGEAWGFQGVSFDLVDLTGDGILDVWVDHAYGIAAISFQNGEFREVCSAYTSTRRKTPMEYVDLDNDGIYEIKIPDRISIDRMPGAAYLPWTSLYEWDGNTYILNNERFYAENDEFLVDLLDYYNHLLFQFGRYIPQCEVYSFYIGLAFYYRGNVSMARAYLQWVVEHAEKQDYVHAAEDILKKLPPRRR